MTGNLGYQPLELKTEKDENDGQSSNQYSILRTELAKLICTCIIHLTAENLHVDIPAPTMQRMFLPAWMHRNKSIVRCVTHLNDCHAAHKQRLTFTTLNVIGHSLQRQLIQNLFWCAEAQRAGEKVTQKVHWWWKTELSGMRF